MKTKIPNIVLLGLPKGTPVPKTVVRMTTIVDTMAVNKATFPSPTPSLAQVTSDIAALTSAETAYKSHLGTKEARDEALAVVVTDAHALVTYVQSVVNASPSQAATIAANAAMTLKKTGSHTKNALATSQKVSGVVLVSAKALKGAKANNWQYSTDGGKTWVDVPETTKARTAIPGLTPGVTVHVRHRALTSTGLTDWSQSISHFVS